MPEENLYIYCVDKSEKGGWMAYGKDKFCDEASEWTFGDDRTKACLLLIMSYCLRGVQRRKESGSIKCAKSIEKILNLLLSKGEQK